MAVCRQIPIPLIVIARLDRATQYPPSFEEAQSRNYHGKFKWIQIGVGKALRLPALRTVHAVFPHTALQSVVSSSGVSRGVPGCICGEQPGICEEVIGPAFMVIEATSEAGPLVLLSQHCT